MLIDLTEQTIHGLDHFVVENIAGFIQGAISSECCPEVPVRGKILIPPTNRRTGPVSATMISV